MDKTKYKELKHQQYLESQRYSEQCIKCNKPIRQTDAEYSNYKFNNTYCAKCCPNQDIHGNGTDCLRKAAQKDWVNQNPIQDIPF